jgi:hypothetical protein
MTMNLYQASNQWAHRPDDERFNNLDQLFTAVSERRANSTEKVVSIRDFNAGVGIDSNDNDILHVNFGKGIQQPTHWAFQQLANLASAPAAYLRSLPPALAAQCLNTSMNDRTNDYFKSLTLTTDESDIMTAATGAKYGRIWDVEVVEAAHQIIEKTGGRFYNPPAYMKRGDRIVMGADGKPLIEPAGLYASDRDVFMFFIDGGSRLEAGGERDVLHRGFFMWNSEVGKATFGLKTFLFRDCCGNHIVWDAQDTITLKIKHTSAAPYRFAEEAVPALKELTAASARPAELQIKRAKEYALPRTRGAEAGSKDGEFEKFLTAHGFSKGEGRKAIEYAEREEGACVSLWDFINGITAYARDLAYVDARIDLETRAGSLLNLVKE